MIGWRGPEWVVVEADTASLSDFEVCTWVGLFDGAVSSCQSMFQPYQSTVLNGTRVVGLPKPYTALMVSLPARPLTISSRFLSATFLDNPSWPFGLLMGHHTLPAKGSVIIFNREFCKSWTTSVEGHQRLQVRCKEGDDSIRESDPPSTSHLGDDLARRGSRPENERLTFKDVQFVDFSGRTNGRTVSERTRRSSRR